MYEVWIFSSQKWDKMWDLLSKRTIYQHQSWRWLWVSCLPIIIYSIAYINECVSCTPPCYECASDNKWLSCIKGYYLLYDTPGGKTGKCIFSMTYPISQENIPLNYNIRIGSDPHSLTLFVKPNYVETTGDGTYSNPFGHIVKALEYADEQSADKGETTVNIYLLSGGSHFMTKNPTHYSYAKSKSSQYSYNQNVIIQPAFWGQTVGGHIFGPADADCISTTEKMPVYYKMGNDFSFTVPLSLTVKSIIFDALDSSIDPTGNIQNIK